MHLIVNFQLDIHIVNYAILNKIIFKNNKKARIITTKVSIIINR